uniref:Tyr recombinase domain-containing protein n=1 Tax=Xenopus tropicalis TaxID=8364 RepID=A0A803J2D4_XENTR
MAILNNRQVGSPTRCFGLQDPIPPRPPLQVYRVKYPSHGTKETRSQTSHKHHANRQSGHTSTSTRKEGGFLLKPLPRPKEGRVIPAGIRPEGLKQVPSGTVVQNGITSLRYSQRPARGLLHVHRLKRRLPTHTYTPRPPEIPTLRIRRKSLPVSGLTLRPGHGSTCLHKGNGSLGGLHATTGTLRTPIPRRPPTASPDPCPSTKRNHNMRTHLRGTRVADTPQKKYAATNTVHHLSGRPIRLQATQSLPDKGKTEMHISRGTTSRILHGNHRKDMHAPSGPDDLNHRGSAFCSISHAAATTGVPQTMGKASPQPQQPNTPVPPHKSLLTMVASTQQSPKRQDLLLHQLGRHHNRRQLTRLGRRLQSQDGPREMVLTGEGPPHQPTGAPSSVPIHHPLDTPTGGTPSQSPIRQCHHRGIHKSPGGHQEPRRLERGLPDTPVGRGLSLPPYSSIHPGSPQLGGRFPQPKLCRPRGMVPQHNSVPANHTTMGNATGRPDGFPVQSSTSPLLHQISGPTGTRGRCNVHPVDLRLGVHIPSHTHDPPSPPQTPSVPNHSHSHHPVLAEKTVVLRTPNTRNSTAMEAPAKAGPPTPGQTSPPWTGKLGTHGVAIETAIWSRKGFSTRVTSTLMKARKSVTMKAYHRIWNTFLTRCTGTQRSTSKCHIPTLLEFLQNGLDKGLGVNSLKVQVSALSLLFQHQLATHPDVRTFLQAATHIKPPYKSPLPPWDLNLVLRTLQYAPFEPLATSDLKLLTWKVAFLVAISSARRISELGALSHKPPYCIFHEDKAVLRTLPTFIPKVNSAFHLNQEIVLPSLCPKPASPQERLLHNLDVVRALKFYIHRTANTRKSDSLFVLYGPQHKGAKASKASIARWIKALITSIYRDKGLPIPFKTSAHTTRALSTSWALANAASTEQICKAATWSSIHTFTKFYKFNVFSSAEAAFGRKVLQSAVQQ